MSGRRVGGGLWSLEAFSALEESIFLLDSEDEPWSVHLELRARGRVDEGRLRDSVRYALERHPLARARLAGSPGARPAWELPGRLDVDPVEVAECPSDRELSSARDGLQSVRVPLEASPPLRILLTRHPEGDAVVLNVHHAASDGIGALRLLRSVFASYAGAEDPLPPLDPFRARERTGTEGAVGLRGVRASLREVVEAARPATHIVGGIGSEAPGYGIQQVSLSREATAGLIGCPRGQATVNDLLLAALHLCIHAWNRERGQEAARIGVMMPVDLRPRELRHQVVANFSLMVAVATTREERQTPTAALEAVSARTAAIKAGRTAGAALALLRRLQALPAPAKRAVAAAMSSPRRVQTALLTNLGVVEPVWMGEKLQFATGVWLSAPARMPLGVSVGAVTEGGRLHLAVRYRRSLFGAAEAEKFASAYLRVLNEVVGDLWGHGVPAA